MVRTHRTNWKEALYQFECISNIYPEKQIYKCGKGHRGYIVNFEVFFIKTVIINIYSDHLQSN